MNSILEVIYFLNTKGELFFHLQKIKFSEEEAKFFFVEIILCLEYLHEKKFIYRDLKLENVLIDIDGHVRLVDFGISKKGLERTDRTDSFCGSAEYMVIKYV